MSLPRITRLVPVLPSPVTSRIIILFCPASIVTFELGQSVEAVTETPPPRILFPSTLQALVLFPPIKPVWWSPLNPAPDASIKNLSERSLPFTKSRWVPDCAKFPSASVPYTLAPPPV